MRVLIACILTIGLTSERAMAQNECLTNALLAYTKLKTATLQDIPPNGVLSAETLVGLRRMEEAYCYRVAYCLVGDPTARPAFQVPYAVEFAKCLRDEALEKYDAVPK
jgi:hypothetical protein